MVRSLAPSDLERATKRKSIVNMTPPWAEDSYPWDGFVDDNDSPAHSSIRTMESQATQVSLTKSQPQTPTSIMSGYSATPTWSGFAMTNNGSKNYQEPSVKPNTLEMGNCYLEPLHDAYIQTNLQRQHHPSLNDIFKSNNDGSTGQAAASDKCSQYTCICKCPKHGSFGHSHPSMSGVSIKSKKQLQKQSIELTRGYPTGQCVSSLEPPPKTAWDEMDLCDSSIREHRSSIKTNTAINAENFKMFLNSPLFSTILKSLTIVVSILLFATALGATLTLHNGFDQEDADSTSNATTTLILTLVLSTFIIIYSCFTTIAESRRLPEGMDTSYSKPLIVIFSEVIASIVWAQVMSVTIYVYIWTFGCTLAEEKLSMRLWKQSEMSSAQNQVMERVCHRVGAMIGLEASLVLLLIFNFYTHLAHNFRFIHDIAF
ncbi:hypothetical protein BGZ79_008428 [Entomortierella chlamydospora]|nr:hypothetical protein BGZ79_008428 [Entomortierella chlamydospora]